MSISRSTIAGIALLAVLVLGAIAIPALAQDGTEDTTEGTNEESTEATPEDRYAERRQEFAAALAEELGTDTDTVAAAIETVQADLAEQYRAEHRAALEERLAAAVEEGSLTQEQADAVLDAADAGVFPGRGIGPGHGPGHRGGHGFGPPLGTDGDPGADAGTGTDA